MSPIEVRTRIESLAPGTRAEVTDLTGTQDHYQAHVVSPAFAGRNSLERHQMVYALLKPEIDSGEVHALTIKTVLPGG